MKTSRALCLLCVPVAIAMALGAACSVQETDEDDGSTTGATGGAGGGTSTIDTLTSPHIAGAEFNRMVSYLAADELLGRDEGTPGSQVAREYIIAEMQSCGIQPAVGGGYEQPITTGAGTNVLGIIVGTDPALAERHVIISAHYDAQGSSGNLIYNGADDNAAAVAMALGVGCAIAEQGPKRSVVIALWDSEEPQTFLTDQMGSQFYVANPVIPLAQTDAAIVYELVGSATWEGYPGHFVFGAELSPEVGAAVDATTVPDGLLARRGGLHLFEERPDGHLPLSDYDAFRNAGVPTFMASNGPTERYHTTADTADTLDYGKMELVASYQLNIAWRIIQGDGQPTFVADGNDFARDAAMVQSLLEDAVQPGAYVDSLGMTENMRAALQQDLAEVTAVRQRLDGGEPATNADLLVLRAGIGHMLCPLITGYSEDICIAVF